MVVALPAIAALAAQALASYGVVAFAVGLAVSVAVSVLTAALAGKPKGPGKFDPGWSQIVRASDAPHRYIFGRRLVSGLLAHFDSTGNNNDFLHMFIVVAAHEVAGIDDVYLNGVISTDARFAGLIRINKHLGTDDQAADADAVAELPGWTVDHRGRGVAYIYIRMKWDPEAWPNGVPNVTMLVRGFKHHDPRSGAPAWSRNAALAPRTLLTDSVFGRAVPAARIDDTLAIASANTCDEIVDLTEQAVTFTAATSDVITLADNKIGLEYGDRVEVSSTGTLPGGLAAATDYYWIEGAQDGTASAQGRLASSLANALASTAVNITSAGSGTHTLTRTGELRYTCDGVIGADQIAEDLFAVLEDLGTAMAGPVLRSQGRYRIHAGAPAAVTASFGLDNLRDGFTVRPRTRRRELFNTVSGVYWSAQNFWQAADFPEVTNTTYVAEDGGRKAVRDIELSFSTGSLRAQRIAKSHLEQSRQAMRVTLPFNLSALRVSPWQVIEMTDAGLGWEAKKFRVLQRRIGLHGGIDLEVQEYAATAWDWAGGDATIEDPAANSALPKALAIGTPSGLTLASGTEQLLELGEGSVISRIQVDWTPPTTGFISHYEVEFKRSAETVWTPAPVQTNRDTVRVFIAPVQDKVTYDVQVRAVNTLAMRSAWAIKTGHLVFGKSERPPTPDSLTVERQADGTRKIHVTMADIPADVRSGGGWDVRYRTGPWADFDTMTSLHPTGLLRHFPFETNELAAGSYTFAVKTVDSSGNDSTAALFITVDLGDPRLENVLLVRQEHELAWPGTLADCRIYQNRLYPISAETIADLPSTIAALAATIDDMVTAESPISYTTPVMDVGADSSFTVLVTPVANGTTTVTMRTGTAADGAPTGSFTATGAVAGARYVEVKIEVAGSLPTLSLLTILLDGDEQIDKYTAVNTASETAAWFESVAAGHFRIGSKSGNHAAISSAAITALRGLSGAGWTWTVVNTSSTVDGEPAAEFKIWDGSGALADAIVDVTLSGPHN